SDNPWDDWRRVSRSDGDSDGHRHHVGLDRAGGKFEDNRQHRRGQRREFEKRAADSADFFGADGVGEPGVAANAGQAPVKTNGFMPASITPIGGIHPSSKTTSVVIPIAGFSVRYTGHRSAKNPCTRSAVSRCSAAAFSRSFT